MNASYLAAAIEKFDAAARPVLREFPRRAPGAGEIEVAVEAASVNPIDVRRSTAYGRSLFSLMGAARLPLTLGNDFAGRVMRVGRGVSHLREGDAIFGAAPPSSRGTHANCVVVRASHAVLQPKGMSSAELAAVPYNFLTVAKALQAAGLGAANLDGIDVLVHGGTGGLGMIAVQLLKRRGAYVAATGSDDRLPMCRRAGASLLIDRERDELRALPYRFAATLNFANWDDESALLRLLAPNALGHATTVHPLLGNFDRFGLLRGGMASLSQKRRMRALAPRGARYAWSIFSADRAVLEELAATVGTITLPKVRSYTLADAAGAYMHNEKSLPGRPVLMPSATERAYII
jgi:reticulon-4-interacting protein 1, mitochondrial